MNHSEFASITRELLLDAWGEKFYPQAQLAALFRMIGGISGAEYRQGLEAVSITTARAPSLAQIKAACLPAIQRGFQSRREEQLKQLPGCDWCAGTGWITALKRADPTFDFAFLCSKCRAAELRGFTCSHGSRWWKDDDEEHFIPRLHRSEVAQACARIQVEAFAAEAEQYRRMVAGRAQR